MTPEDFRARAVCLSPSEIDETYIDLCELRGLRRWGSALAYMLIASGTVFGTVLWIMERGAE